MNKRTEFIAPALGLALFAGGLILATTCWSMSRKITNKQIRLAQDLARIEELEQELDRTEQARKIILGQTQPEKAEDILSHAAGSASYEINLIEQQSLQEGWTLKRYDVMLPEMNLNKLTPLLKLLDTYPALHVRNITLTASPTLTGYARVSMEWQCLHPPKGGR